MAERAGASHYGQELRECAPACSGRLCASPTGLPAGTWHPAHDASALTLTSDPPSIAAMEIANAIPTFRPPSDIFSPTLRASILPVARLRGLPRITHALDPDAPAPARAGFPAAPSPGPCLP